MLSATMQAFNAAADWLAGEAFRLKTADQVKRQPLSDRRLREDFGLSAQMAIRWIAQVCEAYSRDQKPRPRFQQSASLPEDPRWRAFQGAPRVSRRTREGRILVPVILGQYPSERVTGNHGQYDLLRRKDVKWFLLGTVELPEGRPPPTTEFMGVDLGVERLATD